LEISLDDDSALRAKVDEALNVYDEYVKNKGDAVPERESEKGDGVGKDGSVE
jgi:polyadenylate-binding protein